MWKHVKGWNVKSLKSELHNWLSFIEKKKREQQWLKPKFDNSKPPWASPCSSQLRGESSNPEHLGSKLRTCPYRLPGPFRGIVHCRFTQWCFGVSLTVLDFCPEKYSNRSLWTHYPLASFLVVLCGKVVHYGSVSNQDSFLFTLSFQSPFQNWLFKSIPFDRPGFQFFSYTLR